MTEQAKAVGDDLRSLNWDTMRDDEKAAWLYAFVLGESVSVEGDSYFLHGYNRVKLVEIDSNLIASCEAALALDDNKAELYLDSCLAEASTITYKGLTQDQIQQPEVARQFYTNLLLLDKETRGRCLFWAQKGEPA